MSLNMLRQNIELLTEVSKKYQELVNKSGITLSSVEMKQIKDILEKFRMYIKFLTANIEQLIKEEENKLTH